MSLLDTLDMGAPISRTRGSKQRVLGMLRWYAGMATSIHGETIENSLPGEYLLLHLEGTGRRRRRDHPVERSAGRSIWKIGPALATGCTVILKPAEEAPLTPLRLGELLMDAGVPPGVVNIVPGYGETAGAALAAHPGVDKVAFTGSHLTGQLIVQASAGNLKRVSLELGGKSPDVVFADADLDMAVPGAGMAVFANSGQICSAGTRLFVERKVYDEFVERVANFGKGLKVGNGVDPDTQIGPLVSEQQYERVTGYLSTGRQEGARPVTGGQALTDGPFAKGYFVPPTVFADVQGRHADCPGRDLRPGYLGDPVYRCRRGHPPRQRHDLWAWERRLDARCQQGPSPRERPARRLGVDQLLPGDGSGRAVRRLQDEWLRPRVRHPADGRVFECKGGLDQNRVRRHNGN